MSAYATIGRMVGYTALGVAGAVAVLTLGTGLAAGAPRAPLAADDPAPAVPFDPGALINAINDYASLLSLLTGGHGAQTGLPATNSAPTVTDPYPMLPGLP
ncbi:hypothetical protein MMAG44476_05641 [Mycolicibacterium mageritense DSM 44476 = CIP 104973]|uniref:Uncharacterized protein n=1 Tax=Mycolicibacterium mageritense TaxID=53462 RepID=A0AAI8U1P0_MYCME|nr:hypothetical protein [Mycolicibacterium mageritense]OKH79092.1 hypothetical protein EB73_36460 [Mycobacterium sp. SWH-M3]MCC9186845.1 hypothetical protein [Mycolicibacterium mageritense]CDO27088.1 hypothetical protein BN978_07653 [Mycolicibacterium mageritense DSM 44476 = CIP 104973]BBX38177.1 hypothetical protein MMAGJ_74590 [Mycolicibacterium mageritense]BDY32813.1 hypothetical protein hbim_06783 [Mycolicibacterium mageritense]